MTFFHTFRIFFFNYFIKNPQITIAFLTHIISTIDGVLKKDSLAQISLNPIQNGVAAKIAQ